MRDRHVDTACSTRQSLARNGRQRVASAGDVIDDDDMPTLVRNRGQRDGIPTHGKLHIACNAKVDDARMGKGNKKQLRCHYIEVPEPRFRNGLR